MLSASYAPSLLNFRKHLIQKFLDEGYKVVVVAPDFESGLEKKLLEMGCEIEPVFLLRNKINIISDLKYLVQLVLLLKKHRPDIMVSYTIKPNLWGAVAAELTKTASISIVTGLGHSFEKGGNKFLTILINRLSKYALNSNMCVIFQNSDDISDLIKLKVLRDKSKAKLVNGSGVDTKHYAVEPLPNNLKFLMLARFIKSKGVIEYCEAAKIIKSKGYEASFILAGQDDSSKDGLKRSQLVKKYGHWVEILKEVEDVRPLITAISVYVLPSYREGTPRSALEAMSMGRPVITSNAPGCRETVVDGQNGLLVESKNITSLVNALENICENSYLIEKMGKKSRQLIMDKFEIDFVTKQYFDHIVNELNGVLK